MTPSLPRALCLSAGLLASAAASAQSWQTRAYTDEMSDESFSVASVESINKVGRVGNEQARLAVRCSDTGRLQAYIEWHQVVSSRDGQIKLRFDSEPAYGLRYMVDTGLTMTFLDIRDNRWHATQVNPLTLKFGPGEAGEAHGRSHVQDIDLDGDLDIILHSDTHESGISCGDREVTLLAKTFDGQAIQGTTTPFG